VFLAYGGDMAAFGELFPTPKISDESAEAGDGDTWRIGPIDLDKGVVTLHRATSRTDDPEIPDDGE
jgi:hypothetical protein